MLLDEALPGSKAAKRLDSLLEVKDAAHYGVLFLAPARTRRALRDAAALVGMTQGG